MNLWKYYDGDLKYPNILNHSHEKEIAKTKSDWAFEYVSNHGEDKELEPIISTSSYHSYWYAKYVLNAQPFPLGEKAITKSSEYSYLYAREILKKSFKMGEPAISKEAGYSYYYAKNILNLTLLLSVTLTSCATSQGLIQLPATTPLPVTTPQQNNQHTAVIALVEDDRIFQESPKTPDIPSLKGGLAQATQDEKARAVARKRKDRKSVV